jgi:hypothetical protein
MRDTDLPPGVREEEEDSPQRTLRTQRGRRGEEKRRVDRITG